MDAEAGVRLILFDIDGTLVKAGGAGRKALDRACRELYGNSGVREISSLAGRTDSYNFKMAHWRSTGRRPKAHETRRLQDKYLDLLPRYVKASVRLGTYEVPTGLRRLLRLLRRDPGVLLGLGTGNIEPAARLKLSPTGLNGYFQVGGFGSDAEHRHTLLKKARRRAERLIGKSIASNDVFVVGDTPFDVRAGRRAGFKTVAVATGYAALEELDRSKPDHLAHDFRRTSQWLQWFGIRS